ncbi:MAG: BACON domain-containing protein [Gemmatimonadales bacterium]
MATPASAVRGTRLPVRTRHLGTGVLLLGLPLLLATCRADQLFKASSTILELQGDTVAVADSVRLTAEVHVDGVVQSGLPLVWSSSDPGIATVDSLGRVRGIARGRAVISVRLRGAATPGDAAPAADTAWVVVPTVLVAPADTTVASVSDTVCLRAAALDTGGDTIPGLIPSFSVTVDPDSTVALVPAGPGCVGTRVRARRGGARATITARLDTATASAGITVQIRAAGLVVSPDSFRLASLGATRQLRDSAFDARGNPIGTPGTTWTSADTTIARVDAAGLVTARANGATWIRARADTARDSARVVVQQLARQLLVTPAADSLRTVGARRTLRAVVRDSLGVAIANAPLLWTNGAPDTATIVAAAGDSAVVEAVREGRASLQASSSAGGGAAADTAELTVQYELRALTVSPKQPKFSRLGDTLRFTAAAEDINGTPITDPRVHWTSSISSRMTIDSVTGLATARDSGTTLVRAEQSGLSDTTTAQVLPPVLTADVSLFSDSALHGTSTTRSTTRAVSNTGTVGTGVRARLARGSSWLSVTSDTFDLPPAGGASILLTASAAGLAEGVHVDTVILTATGAVGSPRRIPVVFRVICPVTAIAPDTVVAATLASSDCRSPRRPGGQSFADLYAFTGGTGDTVRVSLATGAQTDLDTYLYLLDSVGGVVAFNDDCLGAGRNSCLAGVALPAPGRYTIEATSFGPAVAFSYSLTLTRPVAPGAASGLGQFRPGGPAIPATGTTPNTTTEFRATGTDANARDTLRLQVEVRPFGTAFTNTPTQVGAAVPNAGGGVLLSVSAPLSDGVSYRWQARVVDQTGRAGPWTAFGSGASADFTVTTTGPVLTVTPTAVLDSALQGAAGVRTVTLQIANTGTGVLGWTAAEQADSAWLTSSPASGTAPSTLTVELATAGRPAGTYRDTIVVDVPGGATGAPAKIPVTFVIQRPVLAVTPTAVSRATNAGSGATFRDTLRVGNAGSGTLGWTAALARSSTWLTLGKTAGGAPDDIPLTIASAGLTPQTYDDTVIVTANAPGADGSPARIPIRLTVHQPVLAVAPLAVSDSANFGATTPRTAVLRITNADGGTLAWNATHNSAKTWLGLSKSAGGAPPADSIILSLNPTGLAEGVYRDTVEFTSPEANNDPLRVPVEFDILEHNPSVPASPAQLRSNGTTPIGLGATIDEKAVVFKATLTDADPGDTLQLQIELRPVGTPLSNVPTATSGFVANGAPPTAISLAGLSDDVAYRWQARTVDGTGRASAWVGFGGNHPDTADFRVAVPQDPAATDSGQFRSDGSTAIGLGAVTGEATVVLKAKVTDPDPGDVLRLQVEVRKLGEPFIVPTDSSASVVTGATPTVTISGLADDTAYHWRYRAVDQTGRAGPWTAFGANAESVADFRVAVPQDPAATDSAQFRSDGFTTIVTGATIDQATVVLKARLTDPDPGDSLRLQVEVRRLGETFTAPTDSGARVASGATGAVTVAGLADDTAYHWRYRAVDQTGRAGTWMAFGGNVESAADFRLFVPQDPSTSTVPGQFRSNGSTSIGVGATTDESTVVLKATVNDPDPGDVLRLQVEVRRLAVSLTGSPTDSSAQVARGAVASVTITGLADDSAYHWASRACDQTGRCSGWLSFGMNAESAADFFANPVPETPAAPTVLNQFQANGTTVIAVGGTTSADPGTVVLQGLVTDPDPGDLISLEVEVKDVNTAFDGTGLTRGTGVTTGNPARITVTGLAGGLLGTGYFWRARACDQTNQCGAWVSFGGNSDTVVPLLNPADTDFRVP